MQRLLRVLSICLVVIVGSATTLMGAASAQTLSSIADAVDRDGFYSEQEITPVVADAIERARDSNIGFVWLDQEGGDDTRGVAEGILAELATRNSAIRTLIVLDNSAVWVQSLDLDGASAADAASADFARGAVGGGIDAVIAELDGSAQGSATSTDAPTESSTDVAVSTDQAPSSSDGGVPWLWILILGVVAFFAFRWFSGRRRTQNALESAMAEDRAEIREQLKNNADHVIDLGEQIANADDALRRMYEEAAQAYQDVSMGIDDASTPAEIDALDDKIDRAEWQFQVIDARLQGRTPPAEPDWDAPPPPADGPVSGPGGRPGPPGADRPAGRQPVPPLGGNNRIPAPTGSSSGSSAPTRQRRSGRGLGSVLGGLLTSGLGSMLLRMLIGGGLGAMSGSRRTQQRRSQSPSASGGRSGRGSDTGLGGGVLR